MDYHAKYNKYKRKYMELKMNMMSGGADTCEVQAIKTIIEAFNNHGGTAAAEKNVQELMQRAQFQQCNQPIHIKIIIMLYMYLKYRKILLKDPAYQLDDAMYEFINNQKISGQQEISGIMTKSNLMVLGLVNYSGSKTIAYIVMTTYFVALLNEKSMPSTAISTSVSTLVHMNNTYLQQEMVEKLSADETAMKALITHGISITPGMVSGPQKAQSAQQPAETTEAPQPQPITQAEGPAEVASDEDVGE